MNFLRPGLKNLRIYMSFMIYNLILLHCALPFITAITPDDKFTLAPTWFAPDGFIYNLRYVVESQLRFRVENDPEEVVVISFNKPLICERQTNPKHVDACITKSKEGTNGQRQNLGLRCDIEFESLNTSLSDPQIGFRIWYKNNQRALAIDMLCANTRFPASLEPILKLSDPALTGFDAVYFARLKSVAGCPSNASYQRSQVAPITPEEYIEYQNAITGQMLRYYLNDNFKGDMVVEIPGTNDVLEINLKYPLSCQAPHTSTRFQPGNIAACYHPEGQRSQVVGLKDTLLVRRASTNGAILALTGDTCGTNGAHRINIVLHCNYQDPDSEVHVSKRDLAACLVELVITTAVGCGIEVPSTTPKLARPSKAQFRLPEREMQRATPHHISFRDNEYGCLAGNCFNGTGVFVWRSGSVFNGTWKDGERHGMGIQTWTDGRVYTGAWKMGLRSGRGTHLFSSGDKYVGEWNNDMKHGSGEYTWSNGHHYSGSFANDLVDGHGVKLWNDGSQYHGFFKISFPHGLGRMEWPNGTIWSGNWNMGAITEDGILLCQKHKVRYNGKCLDGCPMDHTLRRGQCLKINPRADL